MLPIALCSFHRPWRKKRPCLRCRRVTYLKVLTTKRITRIARAGNQAEAVSLMQPGVVVLIGPGSAPKRIQFLCPCGCKEHVSVNLNPASGPRWRLRIMGGQRISLWPSVQRQSGCRSHFVVVGGDIVMVPDRRRLARRPPWNLSRAEQSPDQNRWRRRGT